MDWQIKKINNKNEFHELENFYRNNFSSIFNIKLTAKYLFWKLKKNINFNGELLVAIYQNKIVGSISLTFKHAIKDNKKILIAEIGDSYVDLGAQKKILKKNIKNKYKPFHEISIFGSLVNEILDLSKRKNFYLIYGVPNNKSIQGYTKHLNFKKLTYLNINNYTLPMINQEKFYLNYFNFFFKIYRLLFSKFFLKNYNLIQDDFINQIEIDKLTSKKNYFDLLKSEEYFIEKYKNNPENNFIFLKIFKNNILKGIYVVKKNEQKKKIEIIDNLSSKNFNLHIAFYMNLKFNYSVSFWEENSLLKFYKRFMLTVFKTRKINIIYLKNEKNINDTFFYNFPLGYSDNF